MKIQVNKHNVGLRIKQLRQDKGYTLEEFGKLLGDYQANKATVLGWENGRSLPNKERLKGIAKLGDMTVNELLYGSVEEFVRENFVNIVQHNRTEVEAEKILSDNNATYFIAHYMGILSNPQDYPGFTDSVNINNIDELISFFNNHIQDYYEQVIKYSEDMSNYTEPIPSLDTLASVHTTTREELALLNTIGALKIDEQKAVVEYIFKLHPDVSSKNEEIKLLADIFGIDIENI